MHQDPSGMLARIPFGLTTGPIEGAEILVAGCRKETVASEMRSRSSTHLVKDELARPPVIGKDTFTLGTASPQALWA